MCSRPERDRRVIQFGEFRQEEMASLLCDLGAAVKRGFLWFNEDDYRTHREDESEKGKAHVVMGLLSQDTGKAVFDGQLQSLDPKNARPPVVTTSDQEADTRDIKLTIGDDGRLQMQFDGLQHLQVIMTDPGTGKSVTTVVGPGSTIEAHLTLTISAAEFGRLASLDYAGFDDTQANGIMADKNAENKLPEAQMSFAKEFRFADLSTDLHLGLKAKIN